MTIDVYVIFVGIMSVGGAILTLYIAKDEPIFDKLRHTKTHNEKIK
jgi:hypothetical protein